MGFILSIIAQLLYFIVGFINTPITIYKFRKKHGFLKALSKHQFQSAKDVDIFGNYKYKHTWNLLFINKDGYKFGVQGETISSALGKNQLRNDLTWFGWFIVYVLWLIDTKYWFVGGHCINSIDK